MRGPGGNELLLAARRIASVLAFAVAPVLAVIGVVAWTIGGSHFFYDFTGGLYDGARAILHGANPYHAAFLHRLAEVERAGGSPSLVYSVPVYPAPTMLAVVPLALLPARAAGLLFAVGSLAALIGGLRLLGVRDWRCYGAALISWPTLQALRLGALEPYLLLGLAVLWRGRAGARRSGAVAAAVAAAKLFLWPVAGWLAVTRRWRTIAVAALAGAGGTLLAWALISFAGMSDYPRMLSDVSTLESPGGISLIAAAAAIGVGHAVAQSVSLLLAGGILVIAAAAVRRRRDESLAFGLAVMAALVASPVVWSHYLTLVYVPIALLSPELSVLWLVPLLAYAAPVELTHGDIAQILPYLTVEASVLAALVRRARSAAAETPIGERAPARAGAGRKRLWGPGTAVRLPHGLRSTSLHIAVPRPTKGPRGPLLDWVGDRSPDSNRPTKP